MSDSLQTTMYQDVSIETEQDLLPVPLSNNLSINQLGKITQLSLDGKQISLVNPAVIHHLEKQYQELVTRTNDLLQRCLRMQQQQTIMANTIVRLERELGNKIGYD